MTDTKTYPYPPPSSRQALESPFLGDKASLPNPGLSLTPQDRNKDRVVRYARNHIPIGTGRAFGLDDPGQLVS